MRKKNSKIEFGDQRSQALLKNFRASLAAQNQISLNRAFKDAADSPAPRFWVSEARATRIITLLLQGVDLTESMYPKKREMYREIFQRVKKEMHLHPDIPVGDIVFEVVNSPAPSSFMSSKTAQRLILEAKKVAR
ncbi:MAG: hypothetical protein J1D77_08660 [Muribaculaceae bacterium]|nr:hypothetical protein [Muribaculaceae bacterium]